MDKTVIFWDVTDPRQPHRVGQPLAGHNSTILAIDFAPDGRTLATGSSDVATMLWDIVDPNHPRQLGPQLYGR
jgi:WD40 repeat protein